ncbi:unnamed protein product, partial [Arctogadus glacialis]
SPKINFEARHDESSSSDSSQPVVKPQNMTPTEWRSAARWAIFIPNNSMLFVAGCSHGCFLPLEVFCSGTKGRSEH